MKTEILLYVVGAILAYQYAKKQGILPSALVPTVATPVTKPVATPVKPTVALW